MVVGWKVGIGNRASRLSLCGCEVEGVPVKGIRIAVAIRYANRHLEGTKNYCSAANGMWLMVIVPGTMAVVIIVI